MALIGLKYMAAAKAEYADGDVTFSGGMLIGKAISVDKNVEFNDSKLHADNEIAESDNSFSKGTITINTDDYGFKKEDIPKVQAFLFGHEYVAAAEGVPEHIVKNSDDERPFLGVAYVKTRKKNNKLSYEVTLIYKVQFNPGSESAQTKGESVEFKTPTITGSISTCTVNNKAGAYEDTYFFDTYEEAVTFIKTLFAMV